MNVNANEQLADFFASLEDRPLSKPELVSCLSAMANNTAGLKIRCKRLSSAAPLHFIPSGISQNVPRLQRSTLHAPSLPAWDQPSKLQNAVRDSSGGITKTAQAILNALDIEDGVASDSSVAFSFDIHAIEPASASCCMLTEEDVSSYTFY